MAIHRRTMMPVTVGALSSGRRTRSSLVDSSAWTAVVGSHELAAPAPPEPPTSIPVYACPCRAVILQTVTRPLDSATGRIPTTGRIPVAGRDRAGVTGVCPGSDRLERMIFAGAAGAWWRKHQRGLRSVQCCFNEPPRTRDRVRRWPLAAGARRQRHHTRGCRDGRRGGRRLSDRRRRLCASVVELPADRRFRLGGRVGLLRGALWRWRE